MMEDEGISIGSCSTNLTQNMGMLHVSTESIPQHLTAEQKRTECTFAQIFCNTLKQIKTTIKFINLGDDVLA
jgi:hypothetical protein